MILRYSGLEPTRGTTSSAGLDLRVNTFDRGRVGTGTKVAIPEGHYGLVVPRSSLGCKGLSLLNTVGIIDSDYRGEIILMTSGYTPVIGERIAQLIISPYVICETEQVDTLPATGRGDGGFGSTGKD